MAKRSVYSTKQLIADILSFNVNQEALSEHLKHTSIDWDSVVIIASKHLMLPALYCQLKLKGLIDLIPEDLNIYLEEITSINRGRNEILLKEAHEVSEILKKENIEHVFIKGMALLAGHIFKDKAERMIGDIDILVAPNQLDKAFEILTKCGYNETVDFNYEQKNFRHLARQISKQKYGAVELHCDVLIDKYQHLIINQEVIKNKRIINGIPIPSVVDSIKIAILALQINDKAHRMGYLSFKTIYDCLALNIIANNLWQKDFHVEEHEQSFLNLSSVFFKELEPNKPSVYSTCLKYYFVFRLHNPKLGHLIYSLLNTIQNINERMTIIILNKSYRSHIIKNKILRMKN
ncbi:MAG: nucleotidyltransferase family protein [Gelidibacter sp.]